MKYTRITFAILATLGLRVPAFAQRRAPSSPLSTTSWAQIAKLSSVNPRASRIGNSIAMSGNVLVVGAEYGEEATVFVKPPGGWTNTMAPTAKLKGSDILACGTFGYSVAISGNTIVVGDPQSSCFHGASGAAYVFVEPAGGWSGTLTETAKLTASDGATGDNIAYSVAIDANTVVAGAPDQSGNEGAAYIFTKPATGWTNVTQTAKLLPSDGLSNDGFGTSVAISGNLAIACSPAATIGANQAQGAAYVYVQPAAGWSNATQNAKLTASNGQPFDVLGGSVSVSGQTVAVGARQATVGANANQGAAYVFVQPPTGWVNATQNARLTSAGGFPSDYFGSSIAIAGNLIVAGAPWFSHSTNDITSPFFHEGAAYVFTKPATGWANATQTAMLTGSDARFGAYVGTSVALSGSTIVSGALFNNRNLGAVYVFTPYVPQ